MDSYEPRWSSIHKKDIYGAKKSTRYSKHHFFALQNYSFSIIILFLSLTITNSPVFRATASGELQQSEKQLYNSLNIVEVGAAR